MSHFTTIRTQIVEKEYLKQALQDLGYAYQEGAVKVNGYRGNQTTAELKIATSNAGYEIGFNKTGNSYELIADWWGIRDLNQHIAKFGISGFQPESVVPLYFCVDRNQT